MCNIHLLSSVAWFQLINMKILFTYDIIDKINTIENIMIPS